MIEERRVFKFPDRDMKANIEVEINWNPKDEKTNKCKVLKFKFDDKEVYVNKEHFLTFIFMMGNSEEQQKMIPQRITNVRKYETVLGIKAKQDIKKGETINCLVEIPLPDIVNEIIGEHKKDSGIIKAH